MTAAFGFIVICIVLVFTLIMVVVIMRFARLSVRRFDNIRHTPPSPNSNLSQFSLVLQHNEPCTPLEELVRPLHTVDPAFVAADFLTYASRAFVRVRESTGDDVQSLPVTAAMAKRLLEQAQEQTDPSSDLAIRDVNVDEAVISAVRVDERQQAIDVRFAGSYAREMRRDMGSQGLEQGTAAVRFAEIATFVRPTGATSGASDTSAATTAAAAFATATPLARCPQCGGDVVRGVAVCPYCGTRLDQTAAPWLLDAIASAPTSVPALPFDTHGLGATIGMLISGRGAGDSGPTTVAFGKNLRKAVDQIVAVDPNFDQNRFLSWATQAYLSRHETEGASLTIRKAEIFCVVISQAAQNILVLFQCQSADGKKLVEAGIFTRPAGTSTPLQGGQRIAPTCASCGAPLAAGATACTSCGTPVADGTGGWRLETVTTGAVSTHISLQIQKG